MRILHTEWMGIKSGQAIRVLKYLRIAIELEQINRTLALQRFNLEVMKHRTEELYNSFFHYREPR